MTYSIPARREDAVLTALDRLRAARRVILTTHVNADGDGVGCEAALQDWLHGRGARAWIVNPTPFPERYTFLLSDPGVILDAPDKEAKEACHDADLAIVVDTGEISRIGRVRPMIRDLDTIVIDHHQSGPDSIPGISLRDPDACATGELVYDLMRAADGPWTDPVLRGIYVAILTDTGSFRFSNSTPAAHQIAADLIDRGVDPERLHRKVYGARSARSLHLLREALGTLEVDDASLVASMVIPRDAYEKYEPDPEDLDGFVDFPRSVEGVEVGLLFRSTARGDTKISFRSNGNVDVNALARRFGGGGHLKAAGAMIARPIAEVLPEVLEKTLEVARAVRDGEPRQEPRVV